jgi:hypothetical protein
MIGLQRSAVRLASAYLGTPVGGVESPQRRAVQE